MAYGYGRRGSHMRDVNDERPEPQQARATMIGQELLPERAQKAGRQTSDRGAG